MRQATRTRLTFALMAFLAAAAWLVAYWLYRIPPQNDADAVAAPADQLVEAGPSDDGIPSIDDPTFESVVAADQYLKDEGLGLDVSKNGQHRFYPYQILVWHEIVNDVFADQPMLVTFSPLTFSGAVFDPTVDGEALQFGVSGRVWNNDLVMEDRKTHSLWVQMLERAVTGDMNGKTLTRIPSTVMAWKDWKRTYPQGKVLSRDTGFTRDYTRDPYGTYYATNTIWFPLTHTDSRLPLKSYVYGAEVDGKYIAYPAELIESSEDLTGFVGNAQADYLYWFIWSAVHPETDVYLP